MKAEKAYFGDGKLTLSEAIKRAALSRLSDGRLHEHQHLIGYHGMSMAAKALLEHCAAFQTCKTFAELHQRVSALRGRGLRIGELAAYDIAQRIGWYLGIEPTQIYLHRGTREGARALVNGQLGKTISTSALPVELRSVPAAQLEDILCIYKANIRVLMARPALTSN